MLLLYILEEVKDESQHALSIDQLMICSNGNKYIIIIPIVIKSFLVNFLLLREVRWKVSNGVLNAMRPMGLTD